MESLFFGREQNQKIEYKVSVSPKTFDRKRKDMTPLLTFFNNSEKSKLIKNLFKGNTMQFESFMNELNSKVNWQEAFMFIDAELVKRKVDLMSRFAKLLTNRVYQVYFPEDMSIGR
ncbi:MAG: hypothetical protein JSW33_11950 [bacterium]|nr:MAG: hypothetical protein JSW33_11950 [bacterium]